MPYQLQPAARSSPAIRLDKAIIVFGRHPECDVVITSSRKVSRKHCAVAQVNNGFVVRDLGSMNGIRVNGKTIRSSAPLRLGDELIVGDVVFHLKEASSNGKARKPQQPSPGSPPRKPIPKHMISQDIPVMIPDEEQSFAVEESMVKSPTDSDIPVVRNKNDLIDNDSDDEIEIVD